MAESGTSALKKGERFSTTYPLSAEDKEFFMQFNRGCEDRVLSDMNLSEDQIKVARLMDQGGYNAEESKQKLQAHWADPHGVELSRKIVDRWWKVAGVSARKGSRGMSPPEGWPDEPPAWDHDSIWNCNGEVVIAVSQPYPWKLNKDLEKFNDFADEYNLTFRISNYPSWYYPGHCWFIEWHRRDSNRLQYAIIS